jgi:hypothetical protein
MRKVLIVQKLDKIEPVDKDWVFMVKAISNEMMVLENVSDEKRILALPFDMAKLPKDYPFLDIVFIEEPL